MNMAQANSSRASRSPHRLPEIAIAALLLITAAASIAGGLMVESVISAPAPPELTDGRPTLALGALLLSINALGIVFIAVFAFPVLRQVSELAAVGYLSTRIVESALLMIGVATPVLLVSVSEAVTGSGPPPSAVSQTQMQRLAFDLSTPLLGVGGLILTGAMARFGLVPRPLAWFGVLGYTLIGLAGVGGWFDLVEVAPGKPGFWLALPVAAFEIILLPIWLFAKGFRHPA